VPVLIRIDSAFFDGDDTELTTTIAPTDAETDRVVDAIKVIVRGDGLDVERETSHEVDAGPSEFDFDTTVIEGRGDPPSASGVPREDA